MKRYKKRYVLFLSSGVVVLALAILCACVPASPVSPPMATATSTASPTTIPPFCHPADDFATQSVPSLLHFCAVHAASLCLLSCKLPPFLKFYKTPYSKVGLDFPLGLSIMKL
jgi:hypothetical protein